MGSLRGWERRGGRAYRRALVSFGSEGACGQGGRIMLSATGEGGER
jgi:hypothetical protein